MVIWHSTKDAPRCPKEVMGGQPVQIMIGTYPVELGQAVTVEVRVRHANGKRDSFTVEGIWQYNDYASWNSYWLAEIGSFRAGDEVTYAIGGTSGGASAGPEVHGFVVRSPVEEKEGSLKNV
jgi:hypothetical protein